MVKKDYKFGFCENETISEAIYSLLATEILEKEQYDKIVIRHKDMRNNFYKTEEQEINLPIPQYDSFISTTRQAALTSE